MNQVFFWGPMSAIVAGIAVLIWHWRRSHRKWAYKKADYMWTFLQGGIAYVMTIFLIEHLWYGVTYADILARGVGGTQVTLAFGGALFEAVKSIFDLWCGDGHVARSSGNGSAPP